MTSETLEAIKKRFAERRQDSTFRTFDDEAEAWVNAMFADIDSLIAEVERLRSLPMPGRTPMGTVAMIEEMSRVTRTIASATIPAGTIMVGDKIKFKSGGNEA